MTEKHRKIWRQMLARSFHPRQWFEDEEGIRETLMWVYRLIPSKNYWEVGYYNPNKEWHVDTWWPTREEAAGRVHWLNGGGA